LVAKKSQGRCSYCRSTNTVAKTRSSTKKSVAYVISVFFSSQNNREQIEIENNLCCEKCNRCYEKMKTTNKEITTLSSSLIVLNSALVAFRTIFRNNDFSEWITNVSQIVKPEENSLHIIFKICKIRAFLDCHKVKGRFTIVTVEMIL